MNGFFAGMTPPAIAIVGALGASVAWLFVVVWLMDQLAAERRLSHRRQMEAAWRAAHATRPIPTGTMSDTWRRRVGGSDAA